MIYLFDPINGVKTPTSYDKLSKILEVSKDSLRTYKSKTKKYMRINNYIVDNKTSKKVLYELMCKEHPKDEIWKTLDINHNYEVSSYGRIKKLYKNGKEKLIVPCDKAKKWLIVKINDGEKVRQQCIHILVARHFLFEYKKGIPVVHSDGNKYNNRVENLKVLSTKELGHKFGGLAKGIPVLKIDKNTGEVLDFYENIAEAGRENYLSKGTIRQCVRGKQKTAGGFKWQIDKEFLKGAI